MQGKSCKEDDKSCEEDDNDMNNWRLTAIKFPPLSYSMSDVKGKLDELSHGKQDIASAISLDDVNVAVSRAIDHADRRADNIIKSIGGMQLLL